MAALFEPLFGPKSIEDATQHLMEQYEAVTGLVRSGLEAQLAVDAQYEPGPQPGWGTRVKRVPAGAGGQPMAEVVNQCATVERLLDALRWAESEASSSAQVVLVHPGTSSSKGLGRTPTHAGIPVPDHDLVLWNEDAFWVFEVSDVASRRDNNGKTRKDLETLTGTLRAIPTSRAFLVVSPERGGAIDSRSPGLTEEFDLVRCGTTAEETAIFELRRVE